MSVNPPSPTVNPPSPAPAGTEAQSVAGGARIVAEYWVETGLPVEQAVEVLAGEQSCGTFVQVAGESAELTARYRAQVEEITDLGSVAAPSLPNGRVPRNESGEYRQARVRVSWPLHNVGADLINLLAMVAGNLFELPEFTGLRLQGLHLPPEFGERYRGPKFGVSGTRRLTGIPTGPILGTIIKPSVGLSPEQTAARVAELIGSGLDFIKDDELMADPPHSPFRERVDAVMAVIRAQAERNGRQAMYAFNVSGTVEEMYRRHDYVVARGGTCVMASLHGVGPAGVRALTEQAEVPVHGHRNGWGLLYRSPALGLDYTVVQQVWRLLGVDHLHCNGLRNKFCETGASAMRSARACLTPLFRPEDVAMPVIASGQWAGQAHDTLAALGGSDLLYLCGGGIMGHPGGVRAGVASVRQAWAAAVAGVPLAQAARDQEELRAALAFFGQERT